MLKNPYVLTLLVTLLIFGNTAASLAADHLDAPILQAGGVGDVDVNDLYLFQSPTNANNTVLIMTVNPGAGTISGLDFSATASYEFQIFNDDGDALPDITYSTTFSAPSSGSQALSTLRNGVSYASGTTGANIASSSGGMLTAGTYDDPFFFDLDGFQNGLSFTGDDFFAGLNVSAIVLEVPSSELVGSNGPVIGVQARTVDGGSQVDRIGRPAINTVLIDSGNKDAFNQGNPADDPLDFRADVVAAITGLSGDSAFANSLADVLLPDLLTFDTNSSDGFLNGRQLADDVIDAELELLTNGAFTAGDGVDANDVPFSTVFPYLAPANPIPEPSGIALMVLGLSMLGIRQRSGR
jgi:hypothetical protein